jgi:putative RNA 2'-phosphotransferase
MNGYRIKLSKFLSYILRHDPDKYGLKLDKYGNAELDEVLGVLAQRFKDFKKADLCKLVERDPKGRFQITAGKIRATYGHSVQVQPKAKSVKPPEVLYHGTSKESVIRILTDGLEPMGRQFVHLSLNKDDAYAVGLRHDREPVILEIMAEQAYANGVKFFKEGNLYLVKSVPADYIKAREEVEDNF